jgi:hypothetical protein
MEDVLPGIKDILGSVRIMKIMTKTMTNNIITNKLCDGNFTTEKGTQQKLHKVHFPHFELTEESPRELEQFVLCS